MAGAATTTRDRDKPFIVFRMKLFWQDYGRIVAPRHVERVVRLLSGTTGSILCGGSSTADSGAKFLEPTIVDEPSFDDALMKVQARCLVCNCCFHFSV